MIVIAVPAFQSVTKSSAVGIGAGHLVNTLALARAKAVTTRSHVRVIFSTGANTNAIALPCRVTRCCSGRIRIWIRPSTGSTSTVGRPLPKGAYFSGFSGLSTCTVPFPSNQNVGVSMSGIEFNSAGAVASGGTSPLPSRKG